MLKGKRVAERRNVLGWGVSDLAEKSGLSRQHIYHIEEAENYKSSAKTTIALADALGTTRMYLEGLTDNPEPLKIERLSFHAPNVEDNSEAIFKILEREARLIVEERAILKRQREILEGKNKST